jgi:tellurite resistance-related uncharacterized protein
MSAPIALPPGLELVRTTRVFDEETVPAGLLGAHRIAEGVWGRLVVHTGAIGFAFEDDDTPPRHVAAGGSQVIPPGRPHHLVLEGPATFIVEFHRTLSQDGTV